jgi:hypothetical protein
VSSECDELARLIDLGVGRSLPDDVKTSLADAILAAGYQKATPPSLPVAATFKDAEALFNGGAPAVIVLRQ